MLVYLRIVRSEIDEDTGMNNINSLSTHVLIIGALIAILILRLLVSKRSEGQWKLSFPVSIKILSVAGLLFVYAGVSVLVELTPGLAGKVLVILLSVPAGVLVFVAAAEIFASEVSYDERVLSQCSPWRGRVSIPFDDVVRIENTMLWMQYSVYSMNGYVIRLCRWAEGADEVLGYAEEALESAIDPAAASSGQSRASHA